MTDGPPLQGGVIVGSRNPLISEGFCHARQRAAELRNPGRPCCRGRGREDISLGRPYGQGSVVRNKAVAAAGKLRSALYPIIFSKSSIGGSKIFKQTPRTECSSVRGYWSSRSLFSP